MNLRVVFMDLEVSPKTRRIQDIGAIDTFGNWYHGSNIHELMRFLRGADYICGHNIVRHDLQVLSEHVVDPFEISVIDTLFLSPLLFPKKPYHSLVKDDKIISDELNNPVNDSKKAGHLLDDEIAAFQSLSPRKQFIYYTLLKEQPEFCGFFRFLGYRNDGDNIFRAIKEEFFGAICENADIQQIVHAHPVELAYALAIISTNDDASITPRWLQMNYPQLSNVIGILRDTPCKEGCSYCVEKLNIYKALKKFFGYSEYRKYNGEPLQELAVQAAVNGESLLAIFPTGGGKSITFQIPALMAGENIHGLTVVVSPLQSLMKDQVDNLEEKGITGAVTINGLLSPIERKEAMERVENGTASLLYISPEMLRSRTIERILLSRIIVRFVIDEAHCFSSWGQDFRVDYLYIGDFIRRYQEKKQLEHMIPVSCFTATAKQKVVTDICDYFEQKLGLKLQLYTTSADRENLHYTVLYKDSKEEKYQALRDIIQAKKCPTIVYVSRTKKAEEIAEKLVKDGFAAKAFHGQMEPSDKIANQESFIRNETQIIVATSAFGMGVDKKDVKLVVHYNISDSLENYVQESGRAGRDTSIQAECFILFSNDDLDAHFMLLNQTKLSIGEIQQVWKAIKDLTKNRPTLTCSPLEIARQAGWENTSGDDYETRVKTAVSALENAGYVKRGQNVPRVFATSICARSMLEASAMIDNLPLSPLEKDKARTLVSAMISSRTIGHNRGDEAESRVDYLADRNGLERSEVIDIINKLRLGKVLSDEQDMSAFIPREDSEKQGRSTLERFKRIESYVFQYINENGSEVNLKELNESAQNAKIAGVSIKNLRTIFFFLSIKNIIRLVDDRERNSVKVQMMLDSESLEARFRRRIKLCDFIIGYLASMVQYSQISEKTDVKVDFSLVGILNAYLDEPQLFFDGEVTLSDVEDALLYLSKIGAMKLEGGFLVLYNAIQIERKVLDNKIRYKLEDYRMLDEFYKQRIQQIHIVGEYANLMVKDYEAALGFVHDYFGMDYRKFIAKYFKGEREKEILKNITPERYEMLFGNLSEKQKEIIGDVDSKYIVVGAGPGSGKTKLLVHKLASLLLMEDVKHEQLLMLTFSRAAATEFKKRLIELIGGAALFVEIKTFHSYCFDLLGKMGNLEDSSEVVREAARMIDEGEVELGKITKSVLVIDEAQDMDRDEFALVRALMSLNDEMRVIAVGDDDQNIYEFRGSNSDYMALLVREHGAKYYEMVTNFRSKRKIVHVANSFVKCIHNRLKCAEIQSSQSDEGEVNLVYHVSPDFEESVVNSISALQNKRSVCVLTRTNEEALRVTGLLLKNGIRARLIQTLDGFHLSDLFEVRCFLQSVQKCESPVISEEVWQEAKSRLQNRFKKSECLENCMHMIALFEQVNPKQKYLTDFQEYVRESCYEDFYPQNDKEICVSTIHKSKGREFEQVYLYLNNYPLSSDKEKRNIYVGMTRAKNVLNIYHNMADFRHFAGLSERIDNTVYERPKDITIKLTHKDVVLDFYKSRTKETVKYQSGYELTFRDGFFWDHGNKVAKVSLRMAGLVEELQTKGYVPNTAKSRFIVAWKGAEDVKECAVLLPELSFTLQDTEDT